MVIGYRLTERTGVYQSVITAVEGGCRHIDTAYLYLTEDLVGKAVENVIDRGIVKREDLFITTKLSFRVLTRAQVIPSIKESLKRLKLDYVDLVLIHTPCDVLGLKPGFPKKSECSRNHTLEVWKGLEDAKRLCLTRSIGVSNFNSTDMASILADSDTVPAVNQIETNPTFAHQELVAYCQSKNIVVTGYAPFGFLVSRPFNDLALPPTVDDPFLVSQAEKYDVTVNQLKDLRQAVLWAIESGWRTIDTDVNEDIIAEAVNEAIRCGLVTREELFIIARSGKKKFNLLDLWTGMEDAKELGLTKSIGVGNFRKEDLISILPYCTTKPAVNEIEVNPTFTNIELVEYCQKQAIIVMAYAPLGFAVPRPEVTKRPPPSLTDPVLVKMAKKYDVTTAQVLLRYVIERGTVPITRSVNKNHIKQNRDILNFTLTDEEVDIINGYNKNWPVYPAEKRLNDYNIKMEHASRRNKKLY
ncbi:aldo-keto reductase AKR2E4-like [Bicyclus anynana]|uniref:Aldo-keto reductase AKR2E4-like n=1 Tax=Bicyclus anynana TaxID=110368 RepID=A0ABM3LIF7_BICAN|nr:aldo-keto reductase AKR2E4-like [Bicyclus anynana]